MDVYVAPEVAEVGTLHPYLNDPSFRALSIRNMLEQQARTIHAAHARQDRAIRMHVMSWWIEARGRELDDVMAMTFTASDARATMAFEYGFADWATVEALGEATVDSEFETALDLMLEGDGTALETRLEANPSLISAQSVFGHRATLLHYLGANGVESHRQRTPLNAPELAKMLIARGADLTAEAQVYGGGQTPHALASTSAHPHYAGVADELNRILSGAAL